MKKDQLIAWAEKTYHTIPDRPWMKYPQDIVLRHSENKKWYALIMEVSKDKLGLRGDEPVDILNVKIDPNLAGSLLSQEGFFPAYHMNKGNWITILLDDTVPDDQIRALLDMSFELTGSKKKIRPASLIEQINERYCE